MTIPARAAILLGSNHEPRRNLRHAVARLARIGRILAVSPVYLSEDVAAAAGTGSGAPYLNAALLLETSLSAAELKRQALRPLEAELGRVRDAAGAADPDSPDPAAPDSIAPVPIDLDLALYDDLVLDDPALGLRLPAPAILLHRHAAQPLADILPDWRHPVDGRSLARIAADLIADAPPPRAVLGEGAGGRGLGSSAGRGPKSSAVRGPGSSDAVPPALWRVPDLDLAPRPPRSKDPRERAIQTFFQGDALVQIPMAPAAFRTVLERLVEGFQEGLDYPEAEVNRLLRPAHEDVATLRRGLVDHGLMRREGGVYRRVG